jgi:hypothetical protein
MVSRVKHVWTTRISFRPEKLGDSQWEQMQCVHMVCSACSLLIAGHFFGSLFNPEKSSETLVNFYHTT